jgi:hypothetical protein
LANSKKDMARLTQAFEFTRQEVESALSLYFEPLRWVSRAVQKLGKRIAPPSSTDFTIGEFEALRTASKEHRRTSVRDDWRARLPERKAKFFGSHIRQLEAAYGIFSVSLNEALELRQVGQIAGACQAIALIPSLLFNVTDQLHTTLQALLGHAKKYRTVPNVAPLDEENFMARRSQRVAQRNSLLAVVVFTKRAAFFYKVSSLEEVIGKLAVDIGIATNAIVSHSSMTPDGEWSVIDSAHFDLNTCLRETIVVLKSFLVAMPDEQLEALEAEMNRSRHREIVGEPVTQYGHGRWTPLTYEDIVDAKKAS